MDAHDHEMVKKLLSVSCETCKAEMGDPCVSRRGTKLGVGQWDKWHKPRHKAAGIYAGDVGEFAKMKDGVKGATSPAHGSVVNSRSMKLKGW